MSGTSTRHEEGQNLEGLRAELARVAMRACDAAERMALEAIDAALVTAGLGNPETVDLLRETGRRLIERTHRMQAETARYLDLARVGAAEGNAPKG